MTTPTKPRDRLGRFLCPECDGDGTIEYALGHPNDPSSPLVERVCPRCKGSAVEACGGCGDPASLLGEDGDHVYCGTGCAHEDENWPDCLVCERPQSVQHAPWCSEEHEWAQRRTVQTAIGGTR
jgi:hypothetical protein